MASSTPINDAAGALVTSILGSDISASKLKKHIEVFSKKLRTYEYNRVTLPEVEEKFDLLQEKLLILNNDEFAGLLRGRLLRTQSHSEKWLPDILDLLWRLADDPINKTRFDELSGYQAENQQTSTSISNDEEADSLVDQEDELWKVPEFSDFSSDDDVILQGAGGGFQGHSSEQKKTSHGTVPSRLEPMNSNDAVQTLSLLQSSQFWQNRSAESHELNEIQFLRETLFLLQGLPTSLYKRADNHYELKNHIQLRSFSKENLRDVARDLGDMALDLERWRTFAKQKESDPCLQTFQFALETNLQHIDNKIRSWEQKIVQRAEDAPTTILQLCLHANDLRTAMGLDKSLLLAVEASGSHSVGVLESLYEHICQAEASCVEAAFQVLLKIFVQCFEVYFQPLRRWMDQGEVHGKQYAFIRESSSSKKSLSDLWTQWYEMEDADVSHYCPRFLKYVQGHIFNIGKTVVFLRRLGDNGEIAGQLSGSILKELREVSSIPLLPFSEVLHVTVQESIQRQLRRATSRLRDQLGSNCGLWDSLDALRSIYFGKNGHLSDKIDLKIFTALDKCDKTWNDQYILRNLVRGIFGQVECIDAARLSVKSAPFSTSTLALRRKSVTILDELHINYALHWSVANVLVKTSRDSYQRISAFLMQIRRARYSLESHSSLFLTSIAWKGGISNGSGTPRRDSCLLHHRLQCFINDVYDHLTNFVLEEAYRELRNDLVNAIDLDGMRAAHNSYCAHLEHACLTSSMTRCILDHVVSVLDLCIQFSDLFGKADSGRRSVQVNPTSFLTADAVDRSSSFIRRIADNERDDSNRSTSDNTSSAPSPPSSPSSSLSQAGDEDDDDEIHDNNIKPKETSHANHKPPPSSQPPPQSKTMSDLTSIFNHHHSSIVQELLRLTNNFNTKSDATIIKTDNNKGGKSRPLPSDGGGGGGGGHYQKSYNRNNDNDNDNDGDDDVSLTTRTTTTWDILARRLNCI